jgi:hypothetical protein
MLSAAAAGAAFMLIAILALTAPRRPSVPQLFFLSLARCCSPARSGHRNTSSGWFRWSCWPGRGCGRTRSGSWPRARDPIGRRAATVWLARGTGAGPSALFLDPATGRLLGLANYRYADGHPCTSEAFGLLFAGYTDSDRLLPRELPGKVYFPAPSAVAANCRAVPGGRQTPAPSQSTPTPEGIPTPTPGWSPTPTPSRKPSPTPDAAPSPTATPSPQGSPSPHRTRLDPPERTKVSSKP